jgi:hypothetical protein
MKKTKAPRPKAIRPKAPNGERKKSETVTILMRKDLRDRLDRSARGRGNSLNHEISVRLESSFSQEAAFGGPKLTQLVHVMASRFIMQGRQAGETMYGPEVSEDQWLADPYCYNRAMLSVFDGLLARHPKRSREGDAEIVEMIRALMAARWNVESGWKPINEKDWE